MIDVALQEWAAICEQLGDGRLILIVRKGGIHEPRGGTFALAHRRFALLPTYLHQDAGRLRGHPPVPADPSPGSLRIALWAEAAGVWKVEDRRRLDRLDLPWTDGELDARFAYRGQPFLVVLALRVHRLASAVVLPDDGSYAGCRSWIPLRQPIDEAGSSPVLADAAFSLRFDAIAQHLGPQTAP